MRKNGLREIINSFLGPSLKEFLNKIKAFKAAKEEFDSAAQNDPDTYNSVNEEELNNTDAYFEAQKKYLFMNKFAKVNESKSREIQKAKNDMESLSHFNTRNNNKNSNYFIKRERYLTAFIDLETYLENCEQSTESTDLNIEHSFIRYYSKAGYIYFLFLENRLDGFLENIQTLINRIDKKEKLGDDIVKPFIFPKINLNCDYITKFISDNNSTISEICYDCDQIQEISNSISSIKKADNFQKIDDLLIKATNSFRTFSEEVFRIEPGCLDTIFMCFLQDSMDSLPQDKLKKILETIKIKLNNLIELFQMITRKLEIVTKVEIL